ncbi:carboxylesterase family protein [Celerinatantimonas yamalensis]|uniref:Carboxylic ester hydrolase n=1 Tax=Celerinatantimonas yamalensis TaxID=559956 RepID=A0ABW9G473_9GAMM
MGIIKWSIVAAVFFCSVVNAFARAPLVQLPSGQIEGLRQNGVDRFLGIRYAKAPEGKRRWQLPQLASLTGTYKAIQEGAVCPQWQDGKLTGQEDCLNLDIYRPHQGQSLPVLVYIHGGNNQTGKANEFNPAALAQALNAVIVQINYRLGVLGFNPLQALKTKNLQQASGNFGLLDQRAALMWVHQHIGAFGGNPKQVTVAGFSAGGRDVMAMLISPLFKGQFQRAIVFSGGMTTAGVAQSQQVFLNAFAPLVVADKIKPTLQQAKDWLHQGGKAVVQYLQQLSLQRLVMLMNNAGIRMNVFPHLYRDGHVLPKQGFQTTTYQSVPVIMLSGQTEFSIFALNDPYFAKAWHDGSLLNTPSLLQQYQFVKHYGGQLYSLFNVQQSAQQMYAHYRAPIYGTEVQLGNDPYVTPGVQMGLLGAFHGIFMPLLDHNWNRHFLGDAFQQPGALALSKYFRRYLANFIRSGNPNGAGLVPWLRWTPKHDQQGQALLMLNANLHKAVINMSSKSYDQQNLIVAMKQDHQLPNAIKLQLIHKVLDGRWFSHALDQSFDSPSLWPAVQK